MQEFKISVDVVISVKVSCELIVIFRITLQRVACK